MVKQITEKNTGHFELFAYTHRVETEMLQVVWTSKECDQLLAE